MGRRCRLPCGRGLVVRTRYLAQVHSMRLSRCSELDLTRLYITLPVAERWGLNYRELFDVSDKFGKLVGLWVGGRGAFWKHKSAAYAVKLGDGRSFDIRIAEGEPSRVLILRDRTVIGEIVGTESLRFCGL